MSVRSASIGIGLVMLLGCSARVPPEAATEILLRLECQTEICERSRRVNVRVAALSRDLPTPSALRELDIKLVAQHAWPLDIPIVPRDPRQLPDAFQVSVQAFDDGAGILLTEARAVTFFVRASQRLLPVRLARCGDRALGSCEPNADCVGTECRTCVDDRCAGTPLVDPKGLAAVDVTLLDRARPALASQSAAKRDRDAAAEAGSDAAMAGARPAADGGTRDVSMESAADGGSSMPAQGAVGMTMPMGMSTGMGAVPTKASDAAAATDPATLAPAPGALAWGEPAAVEELPEDVRMPALASNRAGDVVLGWWQDNADGYQWLRRFHHGAWDDQPLRANGSERPFALWAAPNVGIDGTRRAHAVSFADVNRSAPVRRARWARWAGGSDVQVEADWLAGRVPPNSFPLLLSVLEDGRAVAMLSGPALPPNDVSELFVSRYEQDSWRAPVSIGSLQYAQTDLPQNAANGLGDFVSAFGVTSSGEVLELMLIVGHLDDAPSITHQHLPEPLIGRAQLAIDEQGDAMALFSLGRSDADSHVYFMRYLQSSHSWTQAERATEEVAQSAALALLSGGLPVSVWRQAKTLALSRYVVGQGWGQATAIAGTPAADSSSDVALAVSAHGDMLLAWSQTDGPSAERGVFASHARINSMFTTPSRVASAAASLNLVGTVWDDADHALIVWTQRDAAGMHVDLEWSCTN